jgi:Flp pilus assembly protein TadG
MNSLRTDNSQRGVATVEFALTASFFFMMLIVVIGGGMLFWTHNALVETTRRAARFAATQPASTPAGTVRTTNGCDSTGPSLANIRNYALYGNAAGTGSKLVENLQPSNICVEYVNFGVATGTVSVSITGFTSHFVVPGINRTITMPPYRTTVAGENAGTFPP